MANITENEIREVVNLVLNKMQNSAPPIGTVPITAPENMLVFIVI